jgi:hypothetical protein
MYSITVLNFVNMPLYIRTLSVNITFICTTRRKANLWQTFWSCFLASTSKFNIFSIMYVYSVNGSVFFVCFLFLFLFVFVLCALCWHFLWNVHFWLPLRYSLAFIYTTITKCWIYAPKCKFTIWINIRDLAIVWKICLYPIAHRPHI